MIKSMWGVSKLNLDYRVILFIMHLFKDNKLFGNYGMDVLIFNYF